MATRPKFFSWSKGRQSASEPYHRTGGLLPIIDTTVDHDSTEALLANDIESTSEPGRRRPPNLTIVPPDYKSIERAFFSPASAQQYAALSKSASNLLAVVDDMLRSPTPSATLCSKKAVPIHKPLPSRPRSMSLPSTPEPVELPGSILLENQGFPSPPPVAGSTWNTMRSVRSGNALGSSTIARPVPAQVPPQKKNLGEASLQRRSRVRPNLVTTPSTDSNLTTCSVSTANGDQTSSASSSKIRVGVDPALQRSSLTVDGEPRRNASGASTAHRDDLGTSATPTPTSTRSTQADELKATIAAQDQTISTLQAQFASLRVSHEAHIASLVETHTAEVSSLKNYTKALEDQQSQRTLHHASSNNLLFVLDTTEQPQTPSRDTPQTTAGATSASSVRSFGSALEQQMHASPVQSRDSPEMENLKRKLSAARRPDASNGDMIRELNTYKTSCGALQRQIDLLVAKLNQSKTAEREKQQKLDDIQAKWVDYQKKASAVEQVEKSTVALQNTIDHLEYRLEMANVEKVELEEQLWNLQRMRHIFDPKHPPGLPFPPEKPDNHLQSIRTSMSTVFANESPSNESDLSDPRTLDAFRDQIERLQQETRRKDASIAATDVELDRLQRTNDRLEDESQDLRLQLEIQAQLLAKTKKDEIHMHELRTAIMQRENLIGDKNETLATVKAELKHHKQLLQAEVKRQAMFRLYGEVQDDLPDLTTLASKYDISRWIDGLKLRLKKQNSKNPRSHPANDPETIIEELRDEIDFYVQEIIYFKLDCRGYKSDIKKLKKAAAQTGSLGSGPSDVDSPDLSVHKSTDIPIHAKLISGTSGLGISTSPSPVSTGPSSAIIPVDRPTTPPYTSAPKPVEVETAFKRAKKQLDLKLSSIPQTPPRRKGINTANEADKANPGISPRSVVRLSPERRKPTPPSPDQEIFGELATNFPLSTPAAPKRHGVQRSVSDTGLPVPRTPERSLPINDQAKGAQQKSLGRSNSNSGPAKGKVTPERPPRPRIGLFESPIGDTHATASGLRTPPRVDVMAEAMRNSPDRTYQGPERSLSNSATSKAPATPIANDAIRSSSPTTSSTTPQPLVYRSREGSVVSTTMNLHANANASSPPLVPSTSLSANVPFVIAMGSPHNPALVAPTANVLPTSCSITRNTATKVTSPTSRTGVGGTMASTTPVRSPPPSMGAMKTSYISNTTPTPKPRSATSNRNASISSGTKIEDQAPNWTVFNTDSFAAPTAASRSKTTTPTHSRNVSGSSLRTAITSNLPARMDFMKGKGKARKESISHPTPLDSPFDIDRSTPDGERKRGGVGEAT